MKNSLDTSKKLFLHLASLKITMVCLALTILLVFVGTLYQVNAGLLAAQHNIFRTFFIYWQPEGSSFQIPIFPGGYTLVGILLVNLTASLCFVLKYSFKTLGITCIHLGLFLLVFGEMLSGVFSSESLLPIKINEKKNYSIDITSAEMVLKDLSTDTLHSEIIFPESAIGEGALLAHDALPFTLHVKKVLPNASIQFDDNNMPSRDTTMDIKGIGATASVIEKPPISKEKDVNYLTAWIELEAAGQPLGVWLLSSAIEEEQTISYQGRQYSLAIRPRQIYFPFGIELEEFRRENHPNTTVPKHFSSLVKLYTEDGKFDRKAIISMNDPLSFKGKVFYQASFGEDGAVSVFQVVENYLRPMPYISSALVILGLIYQFMSSYFFCGGKVR